MLQLFCNNLVVFISGRVHVLLCGYKKLTENISWIFALEKQKNTCVKKLFYILLSLLEFENFSHLKSVKATLLKFRHSKGQREVQSGPLITAPVIKRYLLKQWHFSVLLISFIHYFDAIYSREVFLLIHCRCL